MTPMWHLSRAEGVLDCPVRTKSNGSIWKPFPEPDRPARPESRRPSTMHRALPIREASMSRLRSDPYCCQ